MTHARGLLDAQVEADAHAAAQHDYEALGRLFEKFNDRLVRFCELRTFGNTAAAEDVASDTWLRVAQRISTYTCTGAGFQAWLFTIAANECRDRGKCATSRHEQLVGEMIADRHVDHGPTPEESALSVEARTEIADAVARLPRQQRRVILLRYTAGLSTAEVASIMDKSPASVTMLAQRACKRLKPVLLTYAPRMPESAILVALADSERATEPAE